MSDRSPRKPRPSLWAWALEAYASAPVSEACLRLQDLHGQNVPLLLWAAWAGADPAATARAAGLAREWDRAVAAPLRQARRALKGPWPPAPDAARRDLRQQVKAAELRAERLLMETLERGTIRGGVPVPEALASAASAWGEPPPASALQDLARALEGVSQ